VAAEMDEHHSLCLFSLKLGSIAHRLIRSYTSLLGNFSSFSVMSELLFVLLLNKQTNVKLIEMNSDRLLFPVHAVLMSLKFCSVKKCTVTHATSARKLFSLLVKPSLGSLSADMHK
jgi:hypothetical protein